MSAALVILPVIWATESLEMAEEHTESALAIQQEEDSETRQAPPEMAFYRKYTEAMLRRYMQMSTESGRVPSLLGRELRPLTRE